MAACRALREIQLKCEIARPRVYETHPAKKVYTDLGAPWLVKL